MMKSDNLKQISPETLKNWKQLCDVAFDIVAKAALKQRQKAEVSSENN